MSKPRMAALIRERDVLEAEIHAILMAHVQVSDDPGPALLAIEPQSRRLQAIESKILKMTPRAELEARQREIRALLDQMPEEDPDFSVNPHQEFVEFMARMKTRTDLTVEHSRIGIELALPPRPSAREQVKGVLILAAVAAGVLALGHLLGALAFIVLPP